MGTIYIAVIVLQFLATRGNTQNITEVVGTLPGLGEFSNTSEYHAASSSGSESPTWSRVMDGITICLTITGVIVNTGALITLMYHGK